MTKEFGLLIIFAMMGIALKETILAKELSIKPIGYHLALAGMAFAASMMEGPVQSEFTSYPRTLLAAGVVSSVTFVIGYLLARATGKPLKRLPPKETVFSTPPSRPAPSPTFVTNHYTTDNRVFVDARSFTSVNIINIEDARQVFQLPLGFSRRQLIKAYDGRRKMLEKQASRLPRGDAENRRLLTSEQNRVEEAYQLLTDQSASS